MFELFADDTPNARKVSIMLEEIHADYKVTLIDIGKGDQFKEDFKQISPFSFFQLEPDYFFSIAFRLIRLVQFQQIFLILFH